MSRPRRVPNRSTSSRGSAASSLALALAVALPSFGLGAFGHRLFSDGPEAPRVEVSAAPAQETSRAVPRDVQALRVSLSAPAATNRRAEQLRRIGVVGDATDVRRIEPFLDERAPVVRHAALEALATLGVEAGVERVAAFARGPQNDPDVWAAIHALARCDHPSAEALLLELSTSAATWRADIARGALAVRGGPAARRHLHRQLTDGSAAMAWQAAQNVARLGQDVDAALLMRVAAGSGTRAEGALSALASLPGDRTDSFLVELASTSTGMRRSTALRSLGAVRDPAALDVLADEILRGGRWRSDAWSALGQSRAPGALEVLLDLLPEAAQADAWSVATALAARPEPAALQTLRALAAGSDSLANAALASLSTLEDSVVVDLLAARYDDEGRFPPPETLMFLATKGGDAGWSLIEEVLAGGTSADRNSVVWALQMRGDDDARARLVDLARNGDAMMAGQAAGALEGMDEEARDQLRGLLLERLEDGDVNDYGQTVNTLARLGGDEARELLLARMGDGTAQERSQAVTALAQMDDPLARDALRGTLRESEDPTLRSSALNALLWGPDGADAETLEFALDSGDPELQRTALNALPHARVDDAGAKLVAFAGSDDPSIRLTALNGLAQVGGPEAESTLVAALDDPEVAPQVLWSLQSLGTEGARQAVREAASSDDPSVRSQALSALVQDPSAEAGELLRASLDADDEGTVLAAVQALQGRGTTAAAEDLVGLLDRATADGWAPVANQAAWALEAIGGRVAEEHAALIEEARGLSVDIEGIDGFEEHWDEGSLGLGMGGLVFPQ